MKIERQIISMALILDLIGSLVTASIQLSAYAASPSKALIAAAIIKLKAHKNNPTQIPLIIGDFRHDLKYFLSTLKA